MAAYVSFSCFFLHVQTKTSSLEAEVQRMEEKIAAMEIEIKRHTSEQQEITKNCTMLKTHSDCFVEVRNQKSNASRMFDKFKSIESMFSWKVKEIDESKLSLDFSDRNIPELVLSIKVQDECSKKAIDAKVLWKVQERNDYNLSISPKFSKNTLKFIDSCLTQKCKDICKGTKAPSEEIFRTMNQIEWYLGRLSLVGREITTLEKRHQGIFIYYEEKHLPCVLKLNIQTKQRNVVVASFDICEAYPFVIPSVELQSKDVDIKALERHLMKSSRPGFGYLSRICNTISNFI